MELESLSLVDLRNLAKDKGIPNVSKLKKAELIEKILENYNNKNSNSDNPNIDIEENNIIEEKSASNEVEYKLNSEDDEYVEGILELLPDG